MFDVEARRAREERNAALHLAWRAGDAGALRALVTESLPLVHAVASGVRRPGLAWRPIRGAMGRHAREAASVVGRPVNATARPRDTSLDEPIELDDGVGMVTRLEQLAADEPSPEEQTADVERDERVRQVLGTLSPARRAALVAHVTGGAANWLGRRGVWMVRGRLAALAVE